MTTLTEPIAKTLKVDGATLTYDLREGSDAVRPLAEPGEIFRPLEAPPSRPALRGRVAVQGGDEVDQELSHRAPPRAMDWSSDDVGIRA